MKAGDCRHFNGLQHEACDAGVPYADVKDPVARPLRLPCLPNVRWATPTTCATTCAKFAALTQSEEDAFVAEMAELSDLVFEQGLSPCCKAPLEGGTMAHCSACKALVCHDGRRAEAQPRKRSP